METSTEKVIKLLLTFPKRKWKQKELAEAVGCSKAFLSKLTKKLIEKGILARPYKNQIILLSFTNALNFWQTMRKLPKPVYIKTNLNQEEIIKKLEKTPHCLTLFYAAWLRIKFMKTNTVEVYVLKNEINKFVKIFGKESNEPTNFIVFPADKYVFLGSEKINNLRVVSLVQNYVDLMIYGGSGVRVALKLAEKYNLLGV